MHQFRSTYRKGIKRVTLFYLVLFSLHFFSIHGFTDALVLCIEDDGKVNIESEAGSFLSIPSEDTIHADASHHHETPTIGSPRDSHNDVPLSFICSKKQQITRFDQDRTLRALNGILNTKVEELSRSRVFQFISFVPPAIESVIVTSLKTVVLLN